MTQIGDRFADAASQFLGAPFRLHGRSPEFGIDCVGLVICSLGLMGRPPVAPNQYRLRNAKIEPLLKFASRNGFEICESDEWRGDLIMVQPGPAQQHLMIANTSGHYIHAHAGLRRTVSSQRPDDWPVLKHWRLS